MASQGCLTNYHRFLAQACLLIGVAACSNPPPPAPLQGPALPLASPAASPSSSQVVEHRTRDSWTSVSLVSSRTCSGGDLRIAFSDQPRNLTFQAWLLRDNTVHDLSTNFYSRPGIPHAVLLGEVRANEAGDHDATFALRERMGPLPGGGVLVMEPGAHYRVVVALPTQGGLALFYSQPTFKFHSTSATGICEYLASPVPARPVLRTSAPIVCIGDVLRLEGEGFTPGPVVVMVRDITNPRTGSLQRESELARGTVEASGRLALDVPVRAAGDGGAGLWEGQDLEVLVYDQDGTRVTESFFSVCFGRR